ncbi:uncharacterized protein THITE_2107915 [Thermothielavioides terrestris NRRL 8126]|uniref:F-box domain-containing protein n=1 Tax=Thermothielavioides terrestris (strain ATCC 38088 / NRRL 8126) TaxID=578455 RepID=G2QW91_THETT|nr:uncharacterized protein THITE_2107915 [Thermothielavioides terrestris NRRL 8126]AEO63066.1 hypothetical protein THITE_2107915 [Thermothielavioides terrestris NRRL 8126]
MSAAAMGAAMDPQTRSRLVHIPLEVLVRITYFISTTDLGNVRLSCKALERGLFNFFSHEFFRKKQFMASSASLQALIDISNHPTLSPVLKHVIIGADRPGERTSRTDQQNAALLELANADFANLLATGGLRDMLAEAFANLKNLETVDIRDFNSQSRNRDGLGTPWRSYGSTTLAASTNTVVAIKPRSNPDPYINQLFSAVTAALAVAKARPTSLEVLIRGADWRYAWGLYDSAFYIPPRMEASIVPVLEGLRSLHLSLMLTGTAVTRPFIVQKFLSRASNLTWLRLNFSRTTRSDSQHLLSWLALNEADNPPDSFDARPVPFRHLERLDLGGVETDAATIIKLVAKFAPTLTSLYLRRVCLFDSENRHRSTKVNPWASFLTALPRVPGANLRVVDLSCIAHSFDGWRGNVSFKTTDSAPYSREWRCSTNLVTLDKAVAGAVAIMTADMPPEPSPDPMDGMCRRLLGAEGEV